MWKIILTLFLMGTVSNILAQERYVTPIDEGKRDASFVSFRQKLIEIVKNQDVKSLASILDPNITSSFGGNGGITEFKKMWNLGSPKSEFWNEMLTVITNGGVFADTNIFSAPYSFESFPDDLDAFEYKLIFGSNVNLRSRPDSSSKLILQLSYNIVKVDYEKSVKDGTKEGEYLWFMVETLGGMKGFVNSQYVRGSLDYRAIFEKKNGKWKLTAFVAGN